MNWNNPPLAENQPAGGSQPGQEGTQPPGTPGSGKPPTLSVGKTLVLSATGGAATELEVFTVTLDEETIELLPFKTWKQLDRHKWTARGKLPAEPAGLEVALEHVRIVGETVALNDPAGCEKLERLFKDWLVLEAETLDLARKKTRPQTLGAVREPSRQPQSQGLHFRVEVDKRGQVVIHCVQGRDSLASIGLTQAGFNSLSQQGLMRKPRALATGVLHDWVELDGELCSFEKRRNDSARLEQIWKVFVDATSLVNSTSATARPSVSSK